MIEALESFQAANPQIPVLFLAPGRAVDGDALGELPLTPAVLVVDDAHQDPTAITPLLTYLSRVEGTQLVLATRPSGEAALKVEVTRARAAPGQIQEIPVQELQPREARRLVSSLTQDLGVAVGLREHLANQAVDSPDVAVITANLIRRGELTAPLALDAGLRHQVLARYEEVVAAEVPGHNRDAVRRLIAAYAAVGPIEDVPDEVLTALANVADLERIALLRLRQELLDRGVLVTRAGMTRVVPDILGDHILEQEAAVGAYDTGFVTKIWAELGRFNRERLVISLAELDWRLGRQGGPRVMTPIWGAVRDRLRGGTCEELDAELAGYGNIALTQPRTVIEILDDLRGRLDRPEQPRASAVATDDQQDVEAAAAIDGFNAEQEPAPDTDHTRLSATSRVRAKLGLAPPGPDDVRHRMPDLYARCAIAAPQLLERALDALWDLRRRDTRPTNSHPEHAARVLTDRLANLGGLPDPTFPQRIAARAEAWLNEPGAAHDVVTPMFALAPLLAKDGLRHVAETRRRISFQPFLISPSRVRPLRDQIRTILQTQAAGPDLRRAGAAVDLLGEALRQPHGYFGQSVGPEAVTAWADDDLATVRSLATAAELTPSAAIRRRIRSKVGWTAEHATSIEVRHAALTLLTGLDNRDDDLHAVLLNDRFGPLSRRGVPTPTVHELQTMAESAGKADGRGQGEHDQRHIRQRVAERDREAEDRLESVCRRLLHEGDGAAVVARIDAAARETTAIMVNRDPSLWALFRQLGLHRPDLLVELVDAICALPPGPLDGDLDALLNAWLTHDQAAALRWLRGFPGQRREVRLAVASGFVRYAWTDVGPPLRTLHREGLDDPDLEVRDGFLRGSARMLAADPVAMAQRLLEADLSSSAAQGVLEDACGYDGLTWGPALTAAEAQAVLELTDRAGWGEYVVQQIVAGIAAAHPRLFLDHLTLFATQGGDLPDHLPDLGEALEGESSVIARWVVDCASAAAPGQYAPAVGVVFGLGIKPDHGEALAAEVDSIGPGIVEGLLVVLSDVDTWPLTAPTLARSIMRAARQSGADAGESTRAAISSCMTPSHWGGINGVSEELEAARRAAARCAATETDPELREDYAGALAWVEAQRAWDRQQYEQDEDD